MPKLTAGTVLRNPETGAPEYLAAGSDLPDWAVGLVGEHILAESDAEQESTPAGDEPDVDGSDEESTEDASDDENDTESDAEQESTPRRRRTRR